MSNPLPIVMPPPKISRMRLRLSVARRSVLGDRLLEAGDVLDLNLATGELFVAAALPFNAGAVLGLLADGAVNPADASLDEARARLTGLSSPSTRPAPPLRLVKG